MSSSMSNFNFYEIKEPLVFFKMGEFHYNETAKSLNAILINAVENLLNENKGIENLEGLKLVKLFDIDDGKLFKILHNDSTDILDDSEIFDKILTDYVKLSHDNVLLWELRDPVLLNQDTNKRSIDFVNNLSLKKIIKLSSSLLINQKENNVIGRKANELFEMNNPEMIKGVNQFFDNNLYVNNLILRVDSPYEEKGRIFNINLKGYQKNGRLISVLLTSQDVTELTYKEEELSLAKKMLNDAEIVGKQSAFVLWPKLDKSWWSDNYYPLFGLDKNDESASQKIVDLSIILPEYHKTIKDLIDNVSLGIEQKANFKIKKSDGEIRDFEIICTKNMDNYENDYRVNGLIRDITDELALNEEIRERSEAWEKYEDTVPGAFYSYTVNILGEARINYFSDKLIEIANLPSNSSEHTILDYYIKKIHPEDRESFIKSTEDAVRLQVSWEHKHRLTQSDGSYKWIKGLATPKIESNGDIIYFGLLIDVTDEENQTNALNIANHKYALATQTARMGIWELDIEKNIVDFDQQLKHIYLLTDSDRKSLSFQKWLEFVHPNYVLQYEQAFSDATSNATDIDLTYKIIIQGKEYFHNILGIVLLNNEGNPTKILGVSRDVTETLTYQNKLEEINNIYELATQSANMGIWELDLVTNELIWNDSHYAIFNIDKNKSPITYEKFAEIIHVDDLIDLKNNFNSAIHNGNTKLPTYRAVVKGKGICYFDSACTTVFDETNKPVRMMGVVWEVTENVKREEELKHTGIKYQLATKTARMGIWDLELPSMKLNWDNELHNIYGTNKNEDITYPIWQSLVHPEDINRVERHLVLALKGEREFSEVFRHKLADNTWAYNKTKAVVLRNEKNEPNKVLGVSWDVSDMIQYQKSLESLNLKYRLATKSIRFGLWDYNPETNSVIWDPALAEMYGIPNSFEESFPIEQILQVIDVKDRARFHQSIKDSIEKKWVEFNESYTVNNPITGKVRHIEIVCGPQFDENGNIERMLGLSFDNTYAVERELELVQVLETREKLFNVIAHDLKGPISNLIGVSEFLTHDYDDLADEEIKEFLLMIRKSSLTASNLMNNLITWTRNISNRIPFEPKYKTVESLFTTVISFYEETMKLKGISAKIDEQSFKGKIFVDVNMMETILRNLVGNAIKFSSKGDHVTLSAINNLNEVRLIITDSGIGMTDRQIKMILKQDGKFQKSGTAKETGTGLGLIIVQDFVENHNGKLSIISTEKEGSIFSISLPQP